MPAKSRPTSLTAEQIDHLRAELAAGRQPAVWFTPDAVGVDAGHSAKVIAFTEPAEGDFIQVRPTGSSDELTFEPGELTVERPPRRRRGEQEQAAKPSRAKSVANVGTAKSEPAETAAPAGAVGASQPAEQSEPAQPTPATDELLVVRERPTRAAARPARPRQPVPVTVTLASTEDGEWTVDVLSGKKRTVRARAIAASTLASSSWGRRYQSVDQIRWITQPCPSSTCWRRRSRSRAEREA